MVGNTAKKGWFTQITTFYILNNKVSISLMKIETTYIDQYHFFYGETKLTLLNNNCEYNIQEKSCGHKIARRIQQTWRGEQLRNSNINNNLFNNVVLLFNLY